MQCWLGSNCRRCLLVTAVLVCDASARAELPVRFVQSQSGITGWDVAKGGQQNSTKEPGLFRKAGSAIRQSTDGLRTSLRSALNREVVESEPKAPDPWTNSKKAKKPDPQLYVEFARLQEQAGSFQNAEQNYRRALTLDHRHLDALLGLAHLNERIDKPAKAIEYYQQALEYHPHEAAVHNDLAVCYMRLGQYPAAVAALQRAVAIEPSRKLYRNNIARALVAMGRLDEAFQQLTAVHQPAVAYYNLGFLLNERRDYVRALEHFQRALSIDPSFVEARQWTDQLAMRVGGPRLAARRIASQRIGPIPQAIPDHPPPLVPQGFTTPDASAPALQSPFAAPESKSNPIAPQVPSSAQVSHLPRIAGSDSAARQVADRPRPKLGSTLTEDLAQEMSRTSIHPETLFASQTPLVNSEAPGRADMDQSRESIEPQQIAVAESQAVTAVARPPAETTALLVQPNPPTGAVLRSASSDPREAAGTPRSLDTQSSNFRWVVPEGKAKTELVLTPSVNSSQKPAKSPESEPNGGAPAAKLTEDKAASAPDLPPTTNDTWTERTLARQPTYRPPSRY